MAEGLNLVAPSCFLAPFSGATPGPESGFTRTLRADLINTLADLHEVDPALPAGRSLIQMYADHLGLDVSHLC